MYINGQWLEEGPTFEVYNPATGVSIGSVIDVSNEQVLDAVAAAEAAIGLAILVVFFRHRGSIAVEDVNILKG